MRAFQCALDERGTPTCRSCISRLQFEVTLVWDEHLTRLPEAIRAMLLPELIEEISAQVLGAKETLPFWRDCFGPASPRFFLTQPDSPEHKQLWQMM
eukprot:CAMPEP_0174713158 /NCGR_PEP_ID=MMETSP1094-20130205/13932_1 /TAXON_ID=156173 /ORGANISM="Chrysochromulina brevifilum, Strain UTEX LB 985" /LENGTH=96 /DNA_ID=CAMNT_0015912317 /DNA_START=1 /DNA_END=291 /DNA_ORIENTATION=+